MYTWASQRMPNSIGKNLTVVPVGQNGARGVEPGLCPPIDPAL